MPSLKELDIKRVIDGHTHSGGTDHYNLFQGNLPHTQSVRDLIFKSQLAGVEKVVTFPFPSTSYYDIRALVEKKQRKPSGLQNYPYQIENMALLKSCEHSEGMVLPFVCIDPTAKQKQQLDFLSRICDTHQVYGLKLHTLATGSTMEHLIASGFVEFALDKDFPILIHSDLRVEFSHPMKIVALATKFPLLRISIAHLAWLNEETIREVPKLDNLFIDCAPFLYLCDCVRQNSHMITKPNLIDPTNHAKSLLEYFKLLKHDLIWGTDEPWTKSVDANGTIDSDHTYAEEVQVLVDLFNLSPEALRAITNQNTKRFLFGR